MSEHVLNPLEHDSERESPTEGRGAVAVYNEDGEEVNLEKARDAIAKITGVGWSSLTGKRISAEGGGCNRSYFEQGEFTQDLSWNAVQEIRKELRVSWKDLKQLVKNSNLDVLVPWDKFLRWAPNSGIYVERPLNPEGGVWCEGGEHYVLFDPDKNMVVRTLFGNCEEHAKEFSKFVKEEDWVEASLPDDGNDPKWEASVQQDRIRLNKKKDEEKDSKNLVP